MTHSYSISALSVVQLIEGFKTKKFSAVEVTKHYIDRITKHKSLNAFITVSADDALNAAKEADSKIAHSKTSLSETLPLLGVPIALKDLILTKGILSTAGSKILENFIPPYDATVVEKLKSAGAFTIGKTNCDQFGMGSDNANSAYGPCFNPWDESRVSGGSSGGSATAVAGELSPAALGTDTGGSVRQPSSFSGCVGLKPTYGRISRYGVIAYASSLDQIGIMTRDVADCALLSEVLCGHDSKDSTSSPLAVPKFTASLGKSIKGLRIGVPKEYFVKGISPEVETAVKAATKHLESLGASLVEISLPHTEDAIATYYIIAPAEASSNLAKYDGVRYGPRAKNPKDLTDMYCRTRSQGFGAEAKRRIFIGNYVLSSGYYEAYYGRAQKVRTLIAKDFANVFSSACDIIICPVAPTTAWKAGAMTNDPVALYLMDAFTLPASLAGIPGMSVPCGFDSAGMPIGMQILGRPWDEETLFKVASAYEASTEWHHKKPSIAST